MIALGKAEPINNRPNSLGVTESYQNPNTYLLALPVDATVLDGGKYIAIRFEPFYTAALYDETVLFCDGNSVDQFQGKSGVLIITYETRAHQMYKGIACHHLIAVFEVK
jgi:hypothetical protein